MPGSEKACAKALRQEVFACPRNSLETSVAGALQRTSGRRRATVLEGSPSQPAERPGGGVTSRVDGVE